MRKLPVALAIAAAIVGVVYILVADYYLPMGLLSARVAYTRRPAVSYIQGSTGNDYYWDARRLEQLMKDQLGMKVSYGEVPIENAYGATRLDTRETVVSDKLDWNARFSVLAHEAGHVLAPVGLSQRGGEVFAESVGYLVCYRVGLNTGFTSGGYITWYQEGWPVVWSYKREIEWAVDFLDGP